MKFVCDGMEYTVSGTGMRGQYNVRDNYGTPVCIIEVEAERVSVYASDSCALIASAHENYFRDFGRGPLNETHIQRFGVEQYVAHVA